ncbi:MAG: polysaccharide biosynthesis C-terminal domain-containing protein [Clostridia bacterium]|nr:polysaccharide biosynthesis C-terminal domain-containing protein [Clostridia bacterium]
MINTLCSVLRHAVTILCGLILPREILLHYGSEMNGMVLSVARFLSYTMLLELGIGAVIPAALYQPLAARDFRQVSAILSSGRRVFRRIAGISLIYVVLLLALFPAASGIPASAGFILVLGLGTLMHYLVGIPESLLILSDQSGYVLYLLGTVTVLAGTAVQIVLIRSGHPLLLVRLAGTLLNLGSIGVVLLYVRTRYPLERRVRYDAEPIPQKWNGIAQHVAYFVLENVDIVLLTLFTSFREVSVYSVYFMAISGVRRIFISVSGSIQPKLGELIAERDSDGLNRFFAAFEKWNHLFVMIVFGTLFLFLTPFVRVYTEGITDANYNRPVFAALMTAAYALQCLRDPYDKLILASGRFRQTQMNYVIATALNLGISVIAVQFRGLEGVAAGTLAAMAYQVVYMALYDNREILRRSSGNLVRIAVIFLFLFLILPLVARVTEAPAEMLVRRILEPLRGLSK